MIDDFSSHDRNGIFPVMSLISFLDLDFEYDFLY